MMRLPRTLLAGAVVLLGLLSAVGADGAHKLRVVTTIPDFKALVEEIGLEEAMVRWTRMLEPFSGVRVILVQPWNDLKLAQRVGGVKGADTYIGTIDYNVNVLVQALR